MPQVGTAGELKMLHDEKKYLKVHTFFEPFTNPINRLLFKNEASYVFEITF